jgi:cobalt/nickel transport system permease protein
MAHLPDGVLSAPLLIGGACASVGLLAVALRRLDDTRLPQAAVLSAAFFVSSLISVPVGPASVHLLLNGLMGLLLGWLAVPALLVALALQLAFFGHGGLTALGVNTFNLAAPALLVAFLLRPWLRRRAHGLFWVGAAAGALGVLGTAVLVAASLALSDAAYASAARILLLVYLPLAVLEALVSGTVIAFLGRVDPQSLPQPDADPGPDLEPDPNPNVDLNRSSSETEKRRV